MTAFPTLQRSLIDAYIPDNQFRSRDPKFAKQKAKYGKRHQKPKSQQTKKVIPARAFEFDPTTLSCRCPAGNEISFRGVRKDSNENERATFEGRLNQCRHCEITERCMKNPSSADHRKGAGRQVSFALTKGRKATHTDWMTSVPPCGVSTESAVKRVS